MISSQLTSSQILSLTDFNGLLKPRKTNSLLQLEIAARIRLQNQAVRLQQGLKRLFDIMAASLGMLAISPILLAIGLAIKCTSSGPVLYKSERIGKDHKPFSMYKFRTMCTDADAQRDVLRAQENLEGQLFKMDNDPRITKVGRFLRKLSLDELPQLLNVIRGDMSLVGPRPLPQDESDLFQAPYTLRFQVLPGITGIWQVSGRSNLSFNKLCTLELHYVTHWNLFTDLRILLQTLPAVLFSKGAY